MYVREGEGVSTYSSCRRTDPRSRTCRRTCSRPWCRPCQHIAPPGTCCPCRGPPSPGPSGAAPPGTADSQETPEMGQGLEVVLFLLIDRAVKELYKRVYSFPILNLICTTALEDPLSRLELNISPCVLSWPPAGSRQVCR